MATCPGPCVELARSGVVCAGWVCPGLVCASGYAPVGSYAPRVCAGWGMRREVCASVSYAPHRYAPGWCAPMGYAPAVRMRWRLCAGRDGKTERDDGTTGRDDGSRQGNSRYAPAVFGMRHGTGRWIAPRASQHSKKLNTQDKTRQDETEERGQAGNQRTGVCGAAKGSVPWKASLANPWYAPDGYAPGVVCASRYAPGSVCASGYAPVGSYAPAVLVCASGYAPTVRMRPGVCAGVRAISSTF